MVSENLRAYYTGDWERGEGTTEEMSLLAFPKPSSDGADVTFCGRVFHHREVATWSPMVERRVGLYVRRQVMMTRQSGDADGLPSCCEFPVSKYIYMYNPMITRDLRKICTNTTNGEDAVKSTGHGETIEKCASKKLQLFGQVM